jgi:succinate-acetate transporter protein
MLFVFFLIALAIAELIAWYLEDWLLLIPILLVECGVVIIVLGILFALKTEHKRTDSITSYFAFWGCLALILGILWLANTWIPGNVPALIAIFLIWFAVMILVLALREKYRK